MRVAIDATAVVAGDTGVARYVSMLLRELALHDDLDVVPFAIGRGAPPPPGVRRIRLPLRIVHRSWKHLDWPHVERLVGDVDVVHAPDMIPPPTTSPLVMTLHDVLPMRLPHLYSQRARRIAASGLAAAARCSVVVCDCNAVARDVAEALGRPLEDIVVAPPGPLAPPAAVPPAPAPDHFSPVAEPFVLAVGSLTPRKGFDIAATALARLREEGHDAPLLVVAGPDGWRADEVRRSVEGALGPRVRFLGRVGDDALAGLYGHALALVHPSLAEGFGMPVLEALAAGTPVVATDIPPVREVAGEAAALVPVNDADALAQALREVIDDEGRRARMVVAGHERASAYSWARTAATVADAYLRAAAS